MQMDLKLADLTLIRVLKDNTEHMKFLKQMFQDKEDLEISYLGHLENAVDDLTYIVQNDKLENVGYFSMSKPVVNGLGLSVVSLYYGVQTQYRGRGYATSLVREMSEYLLEKVEMLVLSIDRNNLASIAVAKKAGFQVEFADCDEYIFVKYARRLQEAKNKSGQIKA